MDQSINKSLTRNSITFFQYLFEKTPPFKGMRNHHWFSFSYKRFHDQRQHLDHIRWRSPSMSWSKSIRIDNLHQVTTSSCTPKIMWNTISYFNFSLHYIRNILTQGFVSSIESTKRTCTRENAWFWKNNISFFLLRNLFSSRE